MNLSAVHHRCAFTDCYAAGQEEVVIRLHTGKDVTSVSIIHDDPFAGGATGFAAWDGIGEAMILRREGVRSIEISDECTMCRPDRFWSHRYTRGVRGSQGAIITCKEGAM